MEVPPEVVNEAITQNEKWTSNLDVGLNSDNLISRTDYLNRLLSMLMSCSFKHTC